MTKILLRESTYLLFILSYREAGHERHNAHGIRMHTRQNEYENNEYEYEYECECEYDYRYIGIRT